MILRSSLLPFIVENCLRTDAYLKAICKAGINQLTTSVIIVILINIIVEYSKRTSALRLKLPSLSSEAIPINILVLGILTWSKVAQPLSLV